MTRKIVVRQPPRQQQLPGKKKGSRFAEVAGGTAAECAAVCCCCPCGIVNLIVVAVVKLPAGLCRRAIRRNRLRKRAKKRAMLPPKRAPLEVEVEVCSLDAMGLWPPEKSPSAVVSEMEKEMWAKFYSTGFWRSSSQRDEEEEEEEEEED
ncbi:hypothetical protein H6P81_016579 [Aristolochia fimbriata]|uniref:Pollen preferential protein n=1 Tax=Aristolochia fimbriata TaxID=158543 RepID=A0AAV7EAD1_ARIFI|nr:hypothetical protein H6P81_016579 [Aristolochia fimbriata]